MSELGSLASVSGSSYQFNQVAELCDWFEWVWAMIKVGGSICVWVKPSRLVALSLYLGQAIKIGSSISESGSSHQGWWLYLCIWVKSSRLLALSLYLGQVIKVAGSTSVSGSSHQGCWLYLCIWVKLSRLVALSLCLGWSELVGCSNSASVLGHYDL